MSEEDTTAQAVVDEPKNPPLAGGEAVDARDDGLDDALKSFDEALKPRTETPPAPKPGAAPDEVASIKSELTELRKVVFERQFKEDIDPVIKAVRGDIPAEIYDDADVQSWLDREATADPRVSQAWMDRKKDPSGFNRVVASLNKRLAKKFGNLPDKLATEDREAVTAAVRGASTRAPEGKAPNYAKMNDAEYRESVQKEHGFVPM